MKQEGKNRCQKNFNVKENQQRLSFTKEFNLGLLNKTDFKSNSSHFFNTRIIS